MKHTIEVKRKAHFYHLPAKTELKGTVIAIHGYAQLAEDFIQDFEELTKEGLEVYAPEALSKFYGRERKPVASWMTSHERANEIEDYVGFLEQFIDHLSSERKNKPIYFIGFSQGVSTLLRWLNQSNYSATEIHLVAGSIPEELNINHSIKTNAAYYYYGNNDRLVKEEHIALYRQALNSLNLSHNFIEFEGRHEVPKELIDHLKAL